MKLTIVVFVCLALAAIEAIPQHPAHAAGYAAGPAVYSYSYGVNDAGSGNNFGQSESRNGASTEGTYFVQLPDGRLQKVAYTVQGDAGYVADVTYSA